MAKKRGGPKPAPAEPEEVEEQPGSAGAAEDAGGGGGSGGEPSSSGGGGGGGSSEDDGSGSGSDGSSGSGSGSDEDDSGSSSEGSSAPEVSDEPPEASDDEDRFEEVNVEFQFFDPKVDGWWCVVWVCVIWGQGGARGWVGGARRESAWSSSSSPPRWALWGLGLALGGGRGRSFQFLDPKVRQALVGGLFGSDGVADVPARSGRPGGGGKRLGAARR
jgi:hypothetical protein